MKKKAAHQKEKRKNNHTVFVWHTLTISPVDCAPLQVNAIPTKSFNYPNRFHHTDSLVEGIKASKNSFSLQSHLLVVYHPERAGFYLKKIL